MTNADRYKNWFSSMAGQRITAQDIADQLDISRNATNSRMAKGLTADDIFNRVIDDLVFCCFCWSRGFMWARWSLVTRWSLVARVFFAGRMRDGTGLLPLFLGNCFPRLTNAANYGIMRLDGKGTKKIPNRPRNSERKSENDHRHLHPRLGRANPHLRR